MTSFFCWLTCKTESEETEDIHKGFRSESLNLLGTVGYDSIHTRFFFAQPPAMADSSNPEKGRVNPCQATFS